MTASATINYTGRETRRPIVIATDNGPRTIRPRQGRGNARRRAIAESWGTR